MEKPLSIVFVKNTNKLNIFILFKLLVSKLWGFFVPALYFLHLIYEHNLMMSFKWLTYSGTFGNISAFKNIYIHLEVIHRLIFNSKMT